ncbi:MAG: hypothetical protein GY854_01420 [Deltaproteobacteria bacterium]|nr:hypothetical protein [Deltaproteobacteria bacterium]
MPEVDEQPGFNGFESDDFDAYLPEKWNSNMFTLGRRSVKGKLECIGHSLEDELENAGLSLVMRLSDEFPSLWNSKKVDTQWLFFSRDEAARTELTDLIDKERTLADTLADPTPRYRQVFLGVSVNKDHLEIGLRLHHNAWVDRRNLLSLLERDSARTELKELFKRLPEHYEVELSDKETVSPESFAETGLDELADEFDRDRGWFFVGARLPRDQVPVLGVEVVETAQEVFRLLVPVYRFCAWSVDNDAISIDKLAAERNEAIRASREEFDRERAERQVERREKKEQGLKLREEIEQKFLETQAWRQREIAARRAAAARASAAAAAEDARARAEALSAGWSLGDVKDEKGKHEKSNEEIGNKETSSSETKREAKRPRTDVREPRADNRRREKKTRIDDGGRRDVRQQQALSKVSPERAAAIQVGDLVEVKKGFLMGRRGTVQEIDEKGGVKVGFGALSSRLAQDDISGLGPAPPERKYGESSGKRTGRDRNTPRRQNRAKLSKEDGGSSPNRRESRANEKT